MVYGGGDQSFALDQLLDGCGDGILHVGFCMSVGGSGKLRERQNG